MRKILPFFMSTLLVIFVASYWVLNYTGNNADLADGKTYVITVENGMTAEQAGSVMSVQIEKTLRVSELTRCKTIGTRIS